MNQDDYNRAAAWNADANYLPPTALDASETALYAHGMAHAERLVNGAYVSNSQAGARMRLVRRACRPRPSDYEEYYQDDGKGGAAVVAAGALIVLAAFAVAIWGVCAAWPTLTQSGLPR